MQLLETYKKRLSISESVYNRETGSELSTSKKLTIARVLANTSAFLSESFSGSVATQMGDMGKFKKFCLDITTVALPTLIANDLCLVKPMSSVTGYIQYLQFVAGSTKGGVKQGDVFNDPFKLGDMTDSRINYTGSPVVETVAEGDTEFVPAWTPVVGGKVTGITSEGREEEIALVDGKATITAGKYAKIKYTYDNVYIPANDIPVLNAKMSGIALEAKARRIAINYSQMAAFQAKTETGTDLGDVLATQACAELNYEIDSEVVKLIDETAGDAQVTFNKKPQVGVSLADTYEAFAATIEEASRIIYDKTKKHAANYLIIASNVKPILSLMRGWKGVTNAKINGPYFAGTINGVKVYVSPIMAPNRFVAGFNGDDLVTSAVLYAPYMAVVPTQLLGYADGSMVQGFATMYDLKVLNDCLLVAGEVVSE